MTALFCLRSRAVVWTLLLLVGGIVQAGCWWRAAMPAPDAARFVLLAEKMERFGWLRTIRCESEHPGFPTLIWVTQSLGRAAGRDAPDGPAWSVRWAATFPWWLSVLPAYETLRCFVARRAATIGALCYAVSPPLAAVGAEGLSDGLHALLGVTALALMFRHWRRLPQAAGLRRRSSRWAFAGPFLAGGCLGLALTVRAETLLLLATFVCAAAWRWLAVPQWPARRGLLTLGLQWSAGAALIVLPWLAATDAWTPRVACQRLLGRGDGRPGDWGVYTAENSALLLSAIERLPSGAPADFTMKETSRSSRFRGFRAAVMRLGKETLRGLHVSVLPWLFVLANASLRWRRRTLWLDAQRFLHGRHGLPTLLVATVFLASMLYAACAGYLEARHVLLGLLPCWGWAGAGCLALGRAAMTAWRRLPRRQSVLEFRHQAGWVPAGAALAVMLTTTWQPLHVSRQPHRAAGDWLAQRVDPLGLVLDSKGMTALFSGWSTARYDQAQRLFADPRLRYVVVERAEWTAASPRAETLRQLLAACAEEPLTFRQRQGDSPQDVLVFGWHAAQAAPLVSRREAPPASTQSPKLR